MATSAGKRTGIAAVETATRNAQALPLSEDGEARVLTKSEANSGAMAELRAMPPIIEVSDEDYRSFCFPCHALEEADDCNDGY